MLHAGMQEFGQLMMAQPAIGTEFTTFAPLLLIPLLIISWWRSWLTRLCSSVHRLGFEVSLSVDHPGDRCHERTQAAGPFRQPHQFTVALVAPCICRGTRRINLGYRSRLIPVQFMD
jgi:hypothetical protein